MASQITSFSPRQEMLESLAKDISLPDFVGNVPYFANGPLMVNHDTFKSKYGPLTMDHNFYKSRFDGLEVFNTEDGYVVSLRNLVEQKYLLKKLSERFGMELEHGSLSQYYSITMPHIKKGERLRTFLREYRVYTEEVLIRDSSGIFAGNINASDFYSEKGGTEPKIRPNNGCVVKLGEMSDPLEFHFSHVVGMPDSGYFNREDVFWSGDIFPGHWELENKPNDGTRMHIFPAGFNDNGAAGVSFNLHERHFYGEVKFVDPETMIPFGNEQLNFPKPAIIPVSLKSPRK